MSGPFIPTLSNVHKFRKESKDDGDSMRLHLVLSLDNVLLHTVRFSDLSRQEQHYINVGKVSDQPIDDLFIDISSNEITKLRPLVGSFLKEASTRFELSIYTQKTRSYADRMVGLLDPERKYFGNRVIAKGDYTAAGDVRGVERAILAKESCMLMMDVDARVCSKNLLMIEPFNYFASNRRTYRDRYPLKNPDIKEDNYLVDMLDVLKSIHERFFYDYHHPKGVPVDVRMVVSSLRQNVLKGCVIFTGRPDTVTSVARQLGATIVPERSSLVTHVISEFPSRDYARWAMETDKFLVHPDWVFAAYRMWKRPSEDEFWVKFVSKYRSLSCSDVFSL